MIHAMNVREKEVVPVKGDCSLAITDALILFKCEDSHGYDQVYRVYKNESALNLCL